MRLRLAAHLRAHPELALADVAATLQLGRSEFPQRQVLLCRNRQEALTALEQTADATSIELPVSPAIREMSIQQLLQLSCTEDTRAEGLAALGKHWMNGEAIPWQQLYVDTPYRRVPLPTYPFERQRFWLKRAGVQAPPVPTPGQPEPLDDWFYLPTWEKAALPSTPAHSGSAETWLLFLHEQGMGEQLATRLEQAGQTVIRVYPDTQFRCLPTLRRVYHLRPAQRADYIQMLQDLAAAQALPQHMLHAWNLEHSEQIAADAALAYGFSSLLALAQALNEQAALEHLTLHVLTSHAQAVTAHEELDLHRAMLPAVCKVLPQEYIHITCRCLDIDVAEATATLPDLVELLWHELRAQDNEPVIAYRGQIRWLQRYQAVRLDAHDVSARLRQQGVYLIIGGLGHIGLALAEMLARTVQARLVLVGRTALPPRAQWASWLAEHATDQQRVCQQIQHVQRLEALGSSVLLYQADVADKEQLDGAFAAAEQAFGSLHGVIHAAGITDDTAFPSMHQLTLADCAKHFRPKVSGLLTLAQVLQQRSPDFCLLCSSLSTVLGGIGLAAYSAANAFMDAFAHQQHLAGHTYWLSIDWDTWQFQGREAGVSSTHTPTYALSPQEGATVFARALAAPMFSRLIISTSNLDTRLRQWIMLEGLRALPADNEAPAVDARSLSSSWQRGDYTRILTAIWQEILGLPKVGRYDNFFDLGGNSLTGIQVVARIRKLLHAQIPVVALFEAPTVDAMTNYLLTLQEKHDTDGQAQARLLSQRRAAVRQHGDAIAIIGMSGRFPGAPTIEQFWENLRAGVESLTYFSDEELLAAGIEPALLAHPDYVRARPVLHESQVECFDAAFFGYNPREAALLDPQHRLFLECCWEALERAGYDPQRYPGQIGVFGGANISTYLHTLLRQPTLLKSLQEIFNGYQVALSMDKDALTTLVSYKLGLTGPSVAVQTFCSTSLVAVHLASQSLQRGECDMALAGGVSVRVPVKTGHLYQEGGQESPDGHCRAFDARAQGSMFGDGCGVVTLKRLSDALADGDTILAIIKGSAMNNDGSLKVSFTAPGVAGQVAAIEAALANAQVTADSISYVEAHGTGTELGDPIEVTALTKAYRTHTERTQFCMLGSVKTNIGHLDRAAGVSGLIKTVLALQHEELPASLHYETPNPQIDFGQSPFVVNQRLTPWKRGPQVRRAAINSLGMGGTNAHIILEEGPQPQLTHEGRAWQLLLLSARSASSLEAACQNLGVHFQTHPELHLADAAYTLQVGRSVFPYRRMLVCQDMAEATTLLLDPTHQRTLTACEELRDRPVALLFPDSGEQFSALAVELYLQERIFRSWVDRCCDILETYGAGDLRGVLFSVEPLARGQKLHDLATRLQDPAYYQAAVQTATERLQQPALAQPATFILEYALAKLLMHWGIQPQAMLGYGPGEYVAACLADVLALEDALLLVGIRAHLLSSAQSVTSEQIQQHTPRIPYVSSLTGCWMTEQQLSSFTYASCQGQTNSEPVSFTNCLKLLLAQADLLLLETGGQTLSQRAQHYLSETQTNAPWIVSTLASGNAPVMHTLLTALGKLWLAGVRLDWHSFSAQERRQRVVLPTYPFERQRYWLANIDQQTSVQTASPDAKLPDLRDWFFAPVWTQAPLATKGLLTAQSMAASCWLLLADECGLSTQIDRQLRELGQTVITVWPGQIFSQTDEQTYTLPLASRADFALLLKELHRRGQKPERILHMWSLTREQATVEQALSRGFYSLLALAQALGDYEEYTCEIALISQQMQDVLGNERLDPIQATLLGPCRVIPQEYTFLRCRSIDIVLPEITNDATCVTLARQLLDELSNKQGEAVVALRGTRRWLPQFEPVPQDKPVEPHPLLRQRGVYLLTGGLGGLGLAMAAWLAHTYQARLALIGRHGLPPRQQWPAWLAEHEASEQTAQRISRVLELERLGAQVIVLQADVADAADLRKAVEQTTQTFGALHGVLHIAGVPGTGLMQFKTAQQAAQVLAPKVQGTLNLAEALQGCTLDFLALFSSVTATTGGGPGQVDYCAANAFLGAYARSRANAPYPTIAIDWSEWQWNAWEAGLADYGAIARAYFQENRQRLGITFAEGNEAFQRVLASGFAHLVVSTQDFRRVAEQSQFFTAAEVLKRTRQQWSPVARHQRPTLASSYISPGSELEQQIAAIWEDLLGIAPVGLHDNFFELGGNSLLGIELIGRLRRLGRLETLGAHVLYAAPTVSAQASYLTAEQTDTTVDTLLERGKRRRENTRQLMLETRRTR
jgi:acyl transferase domain-containing protein